MAEGQRLEKRLLALHLKQRLETYKVPQLYEQVTAIERTYNGKLNRKFYKQL
jgi:acyl-CoA synthetase (AMP-forming)/AMP-acid ligase II